MKRILAVAAIVTALSACTTGRPSSPASASDDFARLAAEVEHEIRAAEKTGFLWRDTEQVLREARLAQSEGRYDEATQLANKAMRQARLAQQQARDNANARPVYPKP
jgi:hypothetical protein